MEEMQNQPVPEPGKTYSSKNNSFTILSLLLWYDRNCDLLYVFHCITGGRSQYFICHSFQGKGTQNAGDLQSRHHHFGNRDLPVFPHHGSSILSGVLQSGLQAAAQ